MRYLSILSDPNETIDDDDNGINRSITTTNPTQQITTGGFGAYSKNPAEIGATVARWLKNPELLKKMKDSALHAARPSASYDIAREIADMLFLDDDGESSEEPPAGESGGKVGGLSDDGDGDGDGVDYGEAGGWGAAAAVAAGAKGSGERAPERVGVPA